ncbi:MAG: hypothetical protein EZS28_021291 [Streblomastix strix]|uniref:Uncharacterized protein n=1 Tax=Streblomastix strix TaxID=222440 RepID=A0A5J4VKS7_9EUKA|nr:MAG: hypothetical protein EZS28_021291 [Streblomastix strix]
MLTVIESYSKNLCSQVILILGVRNSNEKDISSGVWIVNGLKGFILTPDNKMNEFGMQMLMKLVEESYKNGDEQTGQFAIQIAYELLQCTNAEMKFDLNKSAYKQKILLGIKIATSCVKIIGAKKINSDVVEKILQFSETEEDDIFAAYSIFMRVWKQKEGFSVDTLSKVGQQKKIIELEDKVRREEEEKRRIQVELIRKDERLALIEQENRDLKGENAKLKQTVVVNKRLENVEKKDLSFSFEKETDKGYKVQIERVDGKWRKVTNNTNNALCITIEQVMRQGIVQCEIVDGTLHFFVNDEQQPGFISNIIEPVQFYGILFQQESSFTVKSLRKVSVGISEKLDYEKEIAWIIPEPYQGYRHNWSGIINFDQDQK